MKWTTRILSLLIISSYNVYAVNDIPAGIVEQVDPGRTGDQLTPSPSLPPLLGPEIITPRINKPKNETKQDMVLFEFTGIRFTGNSVFTANKLQKFYARHLNTKISFAELQNIALEITRFYRNSGYILAQVVIPPQEIGDGVVTFEVYEGYVDSFEIEGDIRPATRKLLCKYAAHITAHKPLKLSTLERFSLLANDLPGVKVRSILSPSNNSKGAAKLAMLATQEKNDWYAGANNFNAEILGREQMVGGIHANGYLPGSQTGLRGVMSFYVNRFKYFAFSHKQQLNSNGLGMDAYVSNTNTNPDFKSLDIVALQTPGQAFIVNANIQYPYIRSRQKNLSFAAGVNYLNSHTSYIGTELFNDAIRSINAKIAFNFFLPDQSLNSFEATIYQGLNILNAHASPPTVVGGKTNFNKLTASASRYQNLPARNSYLLVWVKGQYSFTKELSSEKFGFGGAPFGYGYDPSVITGDHGYALKIEPQYDFNVKISAMPKIQLFGFLILARFGT